MKSAMLLLTLFTTIVLALNKPCPGGAFPADLATCHHGHGFLVDLERSCHGICLVGQGHPVLKNMSQLG